MEIKWSQNREGAGQGTWLSMANETMRRVGVTVAHIRADGEEDRSAGILAEVA